MSFVEIYRCLPPSASLSPTFLLPRYSSHAFRRLALFLSVTSLFSLGFSPDVGIGCPLDIPPQVPLSFFRLRSFF